MKYSQITGEKDPN